MSLRNAQAARRGGQCSIAALKNVNPELGDELEVMLQELTPTGFVKYPASSLSKELEKHEVRISVNTLNRHRRRECMCEKSA